MPFKILALIAAISCTTSFAGPTAPSDANHPGSKVYSRTFTQKDLSCLGRAVNVFLPSEAVAGEKFPVVVFGHGQALDLEHYKTTFEHLAKKGVAAVFPMYDTGFWDQDWTRMGRDYVQQTLCAIQQIPALDSARVIFSGHSKGAYIASIAAGITVKESLGLVPHAAIIFESAGADAATLSHIAPSTTLTVVFAQNDTVVERRLSDTIFQSATSARKQFILIKNYADVPADHFWPQTKGSFFGGGPEGPLHYFGLWKWLVGAALNEAYVYGEFAADKGDGTRDDITRNW